MTNLFSFEIKVLGESTGKEYAGLFIYKRPTIGKKRDIAQDTHLLNSGYGNVPEVILINKTVSFLKHSLVECPEWFKDAKFGLDLEDESPFTAISLKIEEYETKRSEELLKVLDNAKGNQ